MSNLPDHIVIEEKDAPQLIKQLSIMTRPPPIPKRKCESAYFGREKEGEPLTVICEAKRCP